MSTNVLAIIILTLTLAVIIAICLMLWREVASARKSRIVIAVGAALTIWATAMTVLARRSFLEPPDLNSPPPIGIVLALALVVTSVCLVASPSLRQLLANQQNLILLNLWRLVGAVFLMLMTTGQVPALWALPAGIGDVIVGAFAPWIARHVGTPRGRQRAIVFNLFGMLDLVVAVGVGIMTSPGPAQVFQTTPPTSEMLTGFPLALVPTFLVPLAFMLHVISLWQLLRGSWSAPRSLAPTDQRRGAR
jgi:hypothetical protein